MALEPVASGAPAAVDVPAVPARDRLLARVADHILAHGVSDISLSELARRVGSNNRMLLYYFGSKEELLAEAAIVAVGRFPRLDLVMERLRGDRGPLADRLRQVWADIAAPENGPFLALFFQAFGVALYHPERNAPFFARMGGDWVDQVRGALEAEGYAAEPALRLATQLVAAWRGLQFALLSGAPRATLEAANDDMVAALPKP